MHRNRASLRSVVARLALACLARLRPRRAANVGHVAGRVPLVLCAASEDTLSAKGCRRRGQNLSTSAILAAPLWRRTRIFAFGEKPPNGRMGGVVKLGAKGWQSFAPFKGA